MKLWNDLLHLFFPRLCLLCDEPLVEGEKTLCLSCLYSLPRTHFHKRPFNPAEQLFAGKTPVTKATSYLYYEKGGKVQQLIYAIKYRGEKEACFQMGKLAAAELYKEDFFEGIDPLPAVRYFFQIAERNGVLGRYPFRRLGRVVVFQPAVGVGHFDAEVFIHLIGGAGGGVF